MTAGSDTLGFREQRLLLQLKCDLLETLSPFFSKNITLLFLDDSYASTAHSENIAVYIQCVSLL
jgi:hypothetical protein